MKKASERKMFPTQELSREERLLQGKKRAMHLLERRDYSRKGLTEKLARDGYEADLISEILAYLDSYHYLDDVRYAESLIRSRKTTKSRRELLYYLKTKGISEEAIETAMESNYHMKEEVFCHPYRESEVSDAEPELSPEITAIRRQLQKYYSTEEELRAMDYATKQKIAAKLYRKGYSEENIRRELYL